jgi:hypothetical protein
MQEVCGPVLGEALATEDNVLSVAGMRLESYLERAGCV